MKLKSLIVCLTLGAFTVSQAWNDTGHMLVAAVAEQNMTQRAKERARLLAEQFGDERTNSFFSCACWADDSKDQTSGVWHYINYHFWDDGRAPSKKPLEQNVVWAIKTFSSQIEQGGINDDVLWKKMFYLVHFVGDVHQPLHTLARDSQGFPDGDRGGNDFKIAPIEGWGKRPVENLHSFWDFGGGAFTTYNKRPLSGDANRDLANTAKNLIKEFPRDSFKEVAEADPEKWALESVAINKQVYNLTEGQAVPQNYITWARNLSKQRVTLAGYRLADLLNRLLDPKQ